MQGAATALSEAESGREVPRAPQVAPPPQPREGEIWASVWCWVRVLENDWHRMGDSELR